MVKCPLALRTGVVGMLLVAGCASGSSVGMPQDLWERPTAYDGDQFEITVYPFDLLQDPERYIMCTHPCTQEEAERVQAVLLPAQQGRFAGWRGDVAVRVTVTFDGRCFAENSLCLLDHRPYLFIESNE